MKVYLVYGERDGFGNDVYLSRVTGSLEKAQEALKKDTFFFGEFYNELDSKKQKRLLKAEKIQSDAIDFIDEGGIYEVRVTK